MKRALWTAVACVSIGLTAAGPIGCNKDDHPAGGAAHSDAVATAVVDLDKVARDLGWMTKLQTNLDAYKNQLKADVVKYAGVYDDEIKTRLQGMVPKDTKENGKVTLSPEQSQQLTQYIVAGRQQVQQLAQGGDQLFNIYRANWIKQYRDALAPIIRQVAQEKKINIVLLTSDSVLFADRSVDVTDAVVDAARGKMPQLTEVPMTRLEGPNAINVNPTAGTQGATSQPATQPVTP